LVPQLSALRAEFAALERDGFVDSATLAATVGPKTPGKRRYHANDHDERLAERSIHQEAQERSQLRGGGGGLQGSAVRLQFRDSLEQENSHNDESNGGEGGGGYIDFGGAGGGYDDGNDDYDNDDQFDTFIANAGPRYSDVSFGDTNTSFLPHSSKADTTGQVIDAIASGSMLQSQNDYTYFNPTTMMPLGTLSGNNAWAGAAHWKRGASTKAKKKAAPKKRAKKKAVANLVPLDVAPDTSLLWPAKDAKKSSSRRGASSSSKYVLSQAMITKWTNQENLLPADVGLQSVEHLTQLFLRPDALVLKSTDPAKTTAAAAPLEKIVAFTLPDWDDGSYGGGDDNDGPGFDFADHSGNHDRTNDDDEDDVLMANLGVRKVAKVRVGYATVAKKVDVKRLKRDLWNQLESQFCVGENENLDLDNEDTAEAMSEAKTDTVTFQDTVRELELQKSQADVTVPFYFICILHLANEKGLELTSTSLDHPLDDFTIRYPSATSMASMETGAVQ
jgi:condensin complex subunit 2